MKRFVVTVATTVSLLAGISPVAVGGVAQAATPSAASLSPVEALFQNTESVAADLAPVAAAAIPLVSTGAVVAAPAPVVSPDPEESIPPQPPDFWVRSERMTGYEYFNDGAIRYANTPAAAYGPDGSIYGYEFRMVSGVPGAPNSNAGSGLCDGSAEGSSVTSPTSIPDTCGQALSRAEMMCYLSPYNGAIGGPQDIKPGMDFSWGTTWRVDVKRWLDRKWTHVLQGKVWVPVATGEYRPGDWNMNEYRYTWGNCQNHTGPYPRTFPCITSIGPVDIRGPFGKGLPVRNSYFSNEYIPETVERKWTVTADNGRPWSELSPIGRNFNGGKLFGYGERRQSIDLVENCAAWSASLPQNESTRLEGWGNYEVVQDTTWTDCTIIYYPGFNQKNFQGCGSQRPETARNYYIQKCDKDNPQGAPLGVRAADGSFSHTRPDWYTNFDPASPDMNCVRTGCRWTNERTNETGLEPVQNGENVRGRSLVWSSQDPDRLLRPRNDSGIIYVAGNGRDLHVKAPDLRIRTLSPTSSSLGTRWTVWEVLPFSTPWNPNLKLGPNAAKQPFESRALEESGVLSYGGDKPLYVDGDPFLQFNRDGTPVFPKDGQKPLVYVDPNGNNEWARELIMNFYRPSWDEYPTWSVRGHFSEAFRMRLGIGGLTSTNGRTAPGVAGRGSIQYVLAETCSTNPTVFSVVNERPTAK